MTWTEVALVMLGGVRAFAIPIAVVGWLAFAGLRLGELILRFDAEDYNHSADAYYKAMGARVAAKCSALLRLAKACLILALVATPVAATPSPQDLWEVRVALLKLQLASPENVQKGVDHLDVIAKTLECKYLGHCPEQKK